MVIWDSRFGISIKFGDLGFKSFCIVIRHYAYWSVEFFSSNNQGYEQMRDSWNTNAFQLEKLLLGKCIWNWQGFGRVRSFKYWHLNQMEINLGQLCYKTVLMKTGVVGEGCKSSTLWYATVPTYPKSPSISIGCPWMPLVCPGCT